MALTERLNKRILDLERENALLKLIIEQKYDSDHEQSIEHHRDNTIRVEL